MQSFPPILAFVLTLVYVIVAVHPKIQQTPSAHLPAFPKVHRVNKTWLYRSAKAKGNLTYSDPYFWLEGSKEDKDVQQFIVDQTKTTETYIQGCKGKNATIEALKEANQYDKYSYVKYISSNKGGNPFYLYSLVRAGTDGTVWYTASIAEFETAKKENFQNPSGKKFLNETLLSADGSANVLYVNTSPDGKIFSYLVIGAGDVGTWYFRNFDSPLVHAKTFPEGGEGKLKDTLPISADQIYWTPDSKGIFWSNTVETDEGTNSILGSKIRYHVWGVVQSKDVIVFDSKRAGDLGEYSFFFTYLSP